MKGIKKLAITLLSFLTLGVASFGLTSCGGFTITPNNNGVSLNSSSQSGNQGNGNVEHQHVWNSGSVTKAATCEEKGEKVYKCLNCDETLTEELDAFGHSKVQRDGKEATCTEVGWKAYTVCERVGCEYTTYEEIPETGHDFGDWHLIESPTCAVVGKEQRECKKDSKHVETREVAKTDDHEAGDDGICTICKGIIKTPLKTPVIKSISDTEIFWDIIPNVEYYLVYILPNNVYVDTRTPSVALEEYFAGNKQLQVYVQAIADENGDFINSDWSELYTFTIQGETITTQKGVGSAVNLLTGGYTEFASGTTSIFDETLFNRLRLEEDTSVKKQQTIVTYADSLQDYLDKITTGASNKMGVDMSVGVDKIAKVTLGYDFEVNASYETKTYNETQAVFYDMDYYYIGKQLEIYGYNDKEKLSSIISKAFKVDAEKVGNGQMSAAEFVKKYGTHIITAGIYGAKFNLHYELLTDKKTAENTFKSDIKQGISAQISGSLYGVDLGLGIEASSETNYEYFTSATNKNSQTKFTATAIGGGATPPSGTNLSAFASNCSEWAASLNDGNYVLIDVPDNSLFFVWDFLGDEYSDVKDILNEYFYSVCDENYYALKDKVSSLYSESAMFDSDRGILTVNFAGLQTYEKAELTGVSYTREENGVDFANGVFTVYSYINGVPVKKVIFKGSYQEIDQSGQRKNTIFNNFSIKFDQGWDTDILIEFESFAYSASNGRVALDFSAVQSQNITINVIGSAYIRGGDGLSAGANGCIGINAKGKDIAITGEQNAMLNVYGGNGIAGVDANGTAGNNGGTGGNGGIGVTAEALSVLNTILEIKGGNGGNGGKGGNGSNGFTNNNYTFDRYVYGIFGAKIQTIYHYDQASSGGTGGIGGAGGNGGMPIESQTVVANEDGAIRLVYGDGGNGGNGGKGGTGGNGHNYYGYASDVSYLHCYDPGQGGNGGNGGKGGNAGHSVIEVYSFDNENIEIISGKNGTPGQGGNPGIGGTGGAGGESHDTANDHYADKALDGDPGQFGAPGEP